MRYSCIHTEPSPPGNANTFYGGGGEYGLLFTKTAHCNTRKMYQNKAGNESLNNPLVKQNKPAILLFFLKALLTVAFLDYMSTTAVTFNHQLTLTNKLHIVD